MSPEAVYWLAVFVAVMIPVWTVFLFVRARLGVSEQAWAIASYGRIDSRGSSVSDATDATDRFRNPRDRPGHCPSCGEPADDYDFDRCWNCARAIR